MDLGKFFSLYNNNPIEDKLFENLDTITKKPFYKIGMFKKLIINGLEFKRQIISFFQSSNDDIELGNIDNAGEFMMYIRGWYWISQIDINDEESVEGIKLTSDEDFLIALKLIISFFEDNEDYEKCAFLKKIQDLVKENLDSPK